MIELNRFLSERIQHPFEWLDFDKLTVENVPEGAGVYKMHISMKILYVGSNTQNMRQSLLQCLLDPCISKARKIQLCSDRLGR